MVFKIMLFSICISSILNTYAYSVCDTNKVYLEIKSHDYEGYVMKSECFKNYLHRMINAKRFWNPDKIEVSLFEYKVKQSLIGKYKQGDFFHSFLKQNLIKYKRQYFGYVNDQGDNCLYTIFVIVGDNVPYKWRIRNLPYYVYDAGHTLFTVMYNVSTKQFINLKLGDY